MGEVERSRYMLYICFIKLAFTIVSVSSASVVALDPLQYPEFDCNHAKLVEDIRAEMTNRD